MLGHRWASFTGYPDSFTTVRIVFCVLQRLLECVKLTGVVIWLSSRTDCRCIVPLQRVHGKQVQVDLFLHSCRYFVKIRVSGLGGLVVLKQIAIRLNMMDFIMFQFFSQMKKYEIITKVFRIVLSGPFITTPAKHLNMNAAGGLLMYLLINALLNTLRTKQHQMAMCSFRTIIFS